MTSIKTNCKTSSQDSRSTLTTA